MFCATPELMEKLLLFLDAVSTWNLAEAHDLTFNILGKAFSWDKLVKRMLPVEYPICEIYLTSDDLTAEKSKTRYLAEIVIMTKSKKWPQMEKDLLHGICKRYPANGDDPLVVVSCSSCLHTHKVSSLGFLLLEEVEAKLDSCAFDIKLNPSPSPPCIP